MQNFRQKVFKSFGFTTRVFSQSYFLFSAQHPRTVSFACVVQSVPAKSLSFFPFLVCLQQPDIQQPPAASLALIKNIVITFQISI